MGEYALIVIGLGGLAFGWLLWKVSKAVALPAAVILPFLIGGAVAIIGGPALRHNKELAALVSVAAALFSGIAIQQFLLVANIASLEAKIEKLQRTLGGQVGPDRQLPPMASPEPPAVQPVTMGTTDSGPDTAAEELEMESRLLRPRR